MVSSVMSPGSPFTTVPVWSECAVGKGRGWLMLASSLVMETVARQSRYGVQSTMRGGVSWSWWMEPWAGIGTSRSQGIKCCHGRGGCLDVTLCTFKTIPCSIQHVTRQSFGIKCESGSETWMTPPTPTSVPSTVAKLNSVVRQAWAAVGPGRVRTLVESMPRRVRAPLATRGGHTRY